jgi:hypothetical protein
MRKELMWQELLKLNIFIEKDYLKSRRDLLGGVIFKVLGAMFGGAGLLVGSTSSGSVGARVRLACFLRPAPLMKLERSSRLLWL